MEGFANIGEAFRQGLQTYSQITNIKGRREAQERQNEMFVLQKQQAEQQVEASKVRNQANLMALQQAQDNQILGKVTEGMGKSVMMNDIKPVYDTFTDPQVQQRYGVKSVGAKTVTDEAQIQNEALASIGATEITEGNWKVVQDFVDSKKHKASVLNRKTNQYEEKYFSDSELNNRLIDISGQSMEDMRTIQKQKQQEAEDKRLKRTRELTKPIRWGKTIAEFKDGVWSVTKDDEAKLTPALEEKRLEKILDMVQKKSPSEIARATQIAYMPGVTFAAKMEKLQPMLVSMNLSSFSKTPGRNTYEAAAKTDVVLKALDFIHAGKQEKFTGGMGAPYAFNKIGNFMGLTYGDETDWTYYETLMETLPTMIGKEITGLGGKLTNQQIKDLKGMMPATAREDKLWSKKMVAVFEKYQEYLGGLIKANLAGGKEVGTLMDKNEAVKWKIEQIRSGTKLEPSKKRLFEQVEEASEPTPAQTKPKVYINRKTGERKIWRGGKWETI